jgi:hypothetical protein
MIHRCMTTFSAGPLELRKFHRQCWNGKLLLMNICPKSHFLFFSRNPTELSLGEFTILTYQCRLRLYFAEIKKILSQLKIATLFLS